MPGRPAALAAAVPLRRHESALSVLRAPSQVLVTNLHRWRGCLLATQVRVFHDIGISHQDIKWVHRASRASSCGPSSCLLSYRFDPA